MVFTLLTNVPPLQGDDSSAGAIAVLIPLGLAVIVMFGVLTFLSRKTAVPPTPSTEVSLPKIGIATGWYPAPDGVQERYYDGQAWTDQFQPLGTSELEESAQEESASTVDTQP